MCDSSPPPARALAAARQLLRARAAREAFPRHEHLPVSRIASRVAESAAPCASRSSARTSKSRFSRATCWRDICSEPKPSAASTARASERACVLDTSGCGRRLLIRAHALRSDAYLRRVAWPRTGVSLKSERERDAAPISGGSRTHTPPPEHPSLASRGVSRVARERRATREHAAALVAQPEAPTRRACTQ